MPDMPLANAMTTAAVTAAAAATEGGAILGLSA
jgi:hypothetical protein